MKIVGVIPARYGSTRLPGKPLKKIGNKTLIHHVYKNAGKCRKLDEIIVATDHQQIYDEVQSFGGRVKLTSTGHTSGTDRVAEVVADIECEYVVNIQGDEPFIEPADIDQLIEDVLARDCQIGSLAKKGITWEEFRNPDCVKVITDKNNFAIYFSRHSIPYIRDNNKTNEEDIPALKHIGVYIFSRELLLEFTKMPVSSLEKLERLEQLRLLERGYKIFITKTTHDSLGIDTPDDLKKAQGAIKRHEFNKKD
jgi:3-deoxy-manno-octulosonate cytidylyltransferase (CMP-KDO synthetase)